MAAVSRTEPPTEGRGLERGERPLTMPGLASHVARAEFSQTETSTSRACTKVVQRYPVARFLEGGRRGGKHVSVVRVSRDFTAPE